MLCMSLLFGCEKDTSTLKNKNSTPINTGIVKDSTAANNQSLDKIIQGFSYKHQSSGLSGDFLYGRSNHISSVLMDALFSTYYLYIMDRIGEQVPVDSMAVEELQEIIATKNTNKYDIWLHIKLNEPTIINKDSSQEFLFLYKKSTGSEKPKLVIAAKSEKNKNYIYFNLKNGDVQINDLTVSIEKIIESDFNSMH